MDRHGIGRAMEREAMAYAEAHLHMTNCWQPPRGKFTGQDIWGVFDFIAIEDEPWYEWPYVVGVQVCQDRACWVEARLKAIDEFAEKAGYPRLKGRVLAYKRHKDGPTTWRLV